MCPFKLHNNCLLTCGESCSKVRSFDCDALVKDVCGFHDVFKTLSYEKQREMLSIYLDAYIDRCEHPASLKDYFLSCYDGCRDEAWRLRMLLCYIGHYVKLHIEKFN